MNLFITLFLFLLGLVFGSFLNVLIYRIPKGFSLMGRSYCPKCKHKISWFDNIPLLSYVFLGGKCRNCGKGISFLYPLVEFSTGLLFVVSYLYSDNLLELILRLFVLCIVIPVFVIDIKYQIIPDNLIYAGIIFSFFYFLLFSTSGFYGNLFSGFLMSLFLLFLHLLTHGRGMGLGDVKFSFFAGFLLGLPYSVIYIYLSFIAGSLVGLVLILFKRSKFGKHIAFGPFLALSFWIVLIWGDFIWKALNQVLL